MAESRIRGRDYRTLQSVELHSENGLITRILPLPDDADLPVMAPGLVDLQVNGFGGLDFNHFPFSTEMVEQVTQLLWQQGVTTFMPTVITASSETIELAVSRVAEACQQHEIVKRAVAGIHLEGPFLSPQDGPRGAHPLAHIKAPDWALFRRWQQAAAGKIALLTISPEWPQAGEFIRECVASGVRVSIGHTAATAENITEAVVAGATLSTHLGNGAHLQLPRHPNYIWQQLAEDRLACALIADGDHLPTSVLKVFMRAKEEQVFLVSDVTRFAGMPAGQYSSPIGGRVELSADGRLSVADQPQLLAGSAKGLFTGVNHLLTQQLTTRQLALEMASLRPARQLNLPVQYGLAPGAPCDLILLRQELTGNLRLQSTWKTGEKVWEACSQ
ncbi:amidohydrolase family protein [Erwiniaceae bacterium BAC15a-03b]|uniref:Amidohydrolase family protein n=1 Tax=Winslowiella arboricola TaxID=2978220 RepID=A0A9J6PQJ2_9GAMM|nr:amidohydrolase family protein [Winslowiella arboricola]MCU5774055.1 amidohydrolase family protein [Winslowiella arboricola]MCU5777012.1 amidohydrolase family protein [Winslowiella arboricola]